MTINNPTFELKNFIDDEGTPYWDIFLDTNKNVSIINGVLSVSQTVVNAIKLWIAEYDYDTTQGIPWDLILGQELNRTALNRFLTKAVLSVKYVTKVLSISYLIDSKKRSAAIDIIYLNTENEEITVNANI